MARIALSFALVSIASTLFAGCMANANPESTDSESAAEDACVYTSTKHVIMCVTPPPPPKPAAASEPSKSSAPGSKSGSASSSNPASSAGSSGSLGTVCATLEAELASQLAAAQACNPEVAIVQCEAWVPTVKCDQPVAQAESAATKQYLETWAEYVAECNPVLPPCPDILTDDTSCAANPGSAGGHLGHCVIGNGKSGGTPTPASN
jgi:hypothetical protein